MSQEPRASQLRAMVFDMDGLLLDTTPMLVAAYTDTIRQLTGQVMIDAELFKVWHLGTVSATLGALIGQPPTAEEIAQHFDNLNRSLSTLSPYEGISEAVERIAALVPVAVFTSSSRAYAEKCIRACSLEQFFSGALLVAAEDVTRQKPSGEGLLHLCERLNVAPNETAYVGDSLNDVLAAREAGALAVTGRWGHYFTDHHPADVICDTPEDMVDLLLARRKGQVRWD